MVLRLIAKSGSIKKYNKIWIPPAHKLYLLNLLVSYYYKPNSNEGEL